jgi:hypothetical protein
LYLASILVRKADLRPLENSTFVREINRREKADSSSVQSATKRFFLIKPIPVAVVVQAGKVER